MSATDPSRRPARAAATSLFGASLRIQAVANTAGNLAFFTAIFLLTPLAIRELGDEGWGIWQLVGATTAYATLLALGLGTAIHYQVAYNLARGDVDRLAIAFTNARVYLGAAAVVLLLLLAVVGKPLLRSLIEAKDIERAWSGLLMTIVPTALTLPLRIYPSSLGGLGRLDIIGVIQALSAAALAAAVWIGFHEGMGLPGFALVMTIGALLPMFPSWVLAHRLLPRGCLRFTRIDRVLFRELIGYSVNSFIYVFGTVVLYQTMKFVAAWRCGGVTAAGEIGLAISIVQTLGVVFVPLFTTLLARFGQLHGTGQADAMRQLLVRSLIASGLLVIPSSFFLLWDADAIFRAWVGAELSARSLADVILATRLMLVGQAAYVFALPSYNALLGIGQHRSFAIGMLATAVANALIGWLVAGLFPRIASLAIVFTVAMLGLVLLVTVPAARLHFRIAHKPVLIRGLLAPLGASLPGAAILSLRPQLGRPIVDLLVDAVLFSASAAPCLEIARRRFLQRAR
jgi:O-antigen/teichoic acid export membrane protein